jgi:hypothetical protein
MDKTELRKHIADLNLLNWQLNELEEEKHRLYASKREVEIELHGLIEGRTVVDIDDKWFLLTPAWAGTDAEVHIEEVQ